MPGNYTAVLKDSLNVQGLITGATYQENKNLLVICGYTSALQPFLYAFYDFNDSRFFSGNKRKFGISLAFSQIEGITTNNGLIYYLSNERFVNGAANSLQKLHVFDMTDYFHPYFTAGLDETGKQFDFQIYPNPAKQEINLISSQSLIGKAYCIADLSGKIVSKGIISTSKIDINNLNCGTYILQVEEIASQRVVVE